MSENKKVKFAEAYLWMKEGYSAKLLFNGYIYQKSVNGNIMSCYTGGEEELCVSDLSIEGDWELIWAFSDEQKRAVELFVKEWKERRTIFAEGTYNDYDNSFDEFVKEWEKR